MLDTEACKMIKTINLNITKLINKIIKFIKFKF